MWKTVHGGLWKRSTQRWTVLRWRYVHIYILTGCIYIFTIVFTYAQILAWKSGVIYFFCLALYTTVGWVFYPLLFAQGAKIDEKFHKWHFLRKTLLKADPHYIFARGTWMKKNSFDIFYAYETWAFTVHLPFGPWCPVRTAGVRKSSKTTISGTPKKWKKLVLLTL